MPWEHVGDCGAGQLPHERDWVLKALGLGVFYVTFVCGEPPEGCELGIMWHDHDLVDYSTVGLWWDPSVMSDPPSPVPFVKWIRQSSCG
jgi:hypothetical protein